MNAMNDLEPLSQAQRYLAATHDVINVSSEFADVNLYDSDAALREAVTREGAAGAHASLSALGARIGAADIERVVQEIDRAELVFRRRGGRVLPEAVVAVRVLRGGELVALHQPLRSTP